MLSYSAKGTVKMSLIRYFQTIFWYFNDPSSDNVGHSEWRLNREEGVGMRRF